MFISTYPVEQDPDVKKQLDDIQSEIDSLYEGYHRIIKDKSGDEVTAYFQSEDGEKRFSRIRELYQQTQEIREAALQREIDAANTSPDKLLESAIKYLNDSIAYLTLDKAFDDNIRDGLRIIGDFKRELDGIAALYMYELEKYPEYQATYKAHIKEALAKYPRSFTVYSDELILGYDAESRALGQPTFSEQYKDVFFKKTAFGCIYYMREDIPLPDGEEKRYIERKRREENRLRYKLKNNVMLQKIKSANSTLANDVFSQPIGERKDRTTKSIKSRKKKKPDEYSTASLLEWSPREWQALDPEKKPYKLTILDRATLDIISNIYSEREAEGKPCYITPAEIYRNITGSDDPHSKVTKTMIDSFDEIINRLGASHLSANIEQELKERGIDLDGGGVMTKHLILIDGEITFTFRNGEVSKGYEIVKPPLIHKYSDKASEVLQIPSEFLAYSGKKRTLETIGIVYYLARRIVNRALSSTILINSIISDGANLDPETISPKKKTTIVKFVEGYLDYLKKAGLIKGYAMQSEGRSWRAFEIIPAPPKLTDKTSK